MHEGKRTRDDAPRDHQHGDPAKGTHTLQHVIAGDGEQQIAEEEDACREPEERVADTEVVIHRERSEADVHAIQECYKVQQDQRRCNAERDSPIDALQICCFGGGGHARTLLHASRNWREDAAVCFQDAGMCFDRLR